jgi:RIO kinase 1
VSISSLWQRLTNSPSPRLKDAEIPVSKLADLYVETLVIMRQLYQQCKLVHADLSEYNILYVPGDGRD